MTATTLAAGTHARARTAPELAGPRAGNARAVVQRTDFQVIAQHMLILMMRNVAADGFLFEDPVQPGRFATPGCVIAAPSYPANSPGVDQDYVFNWTRDAAITAMELAATNMPARPGGGVGPLEDYVRFAAICQGNAMPTLAHACFTIEGNSRPWTEQNDGPALQTVAILQAFAQLDGPTQDLARQVIDRNLDFLVGAYQQPTTSLWEEHSGYSFFARAVQLRCFREIAANTIGVTVPPGCQEAAGWLQDALAGHWDGTRYLTLIGDAEPPTDPAGPGYDPNIDIVMAAIYGAVPIGDPRLLATAAELRRQWSDPAAPTVYPVNLADQDLGIGPMLGRYPADTYDGDVADPVEGGHPWALTTCNFAELYYRLASAVRGTGSVPYQELSAPFFAQVGVAADTPPQDAADALEHAGDRMLQAAIYHSDNLELSEQFDGTTGYCRSVSNLTWSYAAYLSAVRAKTGLAVQG
ncbi:glycoside hydrolase family 15 protein [Jidongwangia harbinensis]|uniref:glycoside hydrolase family 15 protein n=1 Tax=Jidongwangia harbinensis TaxID=2878561 RepID=UPI001CD9FCA9|nr:glycoside hydrolase family 15 protein [Jidongwangia harbinensis]MCA2211364.1 glycoside hydrolase family 15 protein [Jidongwangia harbinensis]